jgi:Zn-dependent protease
MSFGDPVVFLIGSLFLIPAILVAVPVHELGHGVAAYLAGDPSPRNRGYLRFRPRLFINVYGVILAFLANVTFGTPVPVNEYRLQDRWRKLVWALGGPAASLLAAIVFGIGVRALLAQPGAGVSFSARLMSPLVFVTDIVYALFFLNLSTMAFQLIPLPGLDGWRIVEVLFRDRNPRFFFNVQARRQTIWLIAVAVVFFGPLLLHFDVLSAVVGIFFQPASTAILGACAGYTTLIPCPVSGRF